MTHLLEFVWPTRTVVTVPAMRSELAEPASHRSSRRSGPIPLAAVGGVGRRGWLGVRYWERNGSGQFLSGALRRGRQRQAGVADLRRRA
jgi:hypothetical protein